MKGYPHIVFDSLIYNFKKYKENKIKIITIKNYSLFVINKENEFYTSSEFPEFDNIKIDNHKIYEEIIYKFIKFIMMEK